MENNKRIIKFRAWRQDQNNMLYFDLDGLRCEYSKIYENGKFITGIGGGTFVADCIKQQYPIMQYTELIDKNGKEIYEGDIVMLHNEYYVCVYDAPRFWLSRDGTTDSLEDSFYSDSGFIYEIIGNIYENPELLTTNNK